MLDRKPHCLDGFSGFGWSEITVTLSRKGRQGGTAAGFFMFEICAKTTFFDTLNEVKQDSQDVTAGKGFFYPIHKKFISSLNRQVNFDIAKYD